MTKESRKQINLAGIDLLSFSLFSGAAVEQDLKGEPVRCTSAPRVPSDPGRTGQPATNCVFALICRVPRRLCACMHVCAVPAVQCCLQEECVMGISSFSWLPGALLQICSRCVCVCVSKSSRARSPCSLPNS